MKTHVSSVSVKKNTETSGRFGGSQASRADSGATWKLQKPEAGWESEKRNLEISGRLSFCRRTDRPRAFSLAFDEAFFSPFWHEKMRKWVKPAKIYKCEKRATCGALLSTATATHLQRPRNEAHEAHEARAGARGARAGVAIVADLTNDKISIEKNTLQNFSTVFTGGLIRSLGGRTHPQRVAHHQSSHPTPESEHLHAHLGTAREDLRHAVLRQEPEGFTKTPKFENGKGRKHGNSPCDVS